MYPSSVDRKIVTSVSHITIPPFPEPKRLWAPRLPCCSCCHCPVHYESHLQHSRQIVASNSLYCPKEIFSSSLSCMCMRVCLIVSSCVCLCRLVSSCFFVVKGCCPFVLFFCAICAVYPHHFVKSFLSSTPLATTQAHSCKGGGGRRRFGRCIFLPLPAAHLSCRGGGSCCHHGCRVVTNCDTWTVFSFSLCLFIACTTTVGHVTDDLYFCT
jgi:hypothetical protein